MKPEATPWDDCPYAKSNANTFVRASAFRVFQPRVSGSTSRAPLGALGTLGVPPRLIPPHSVGKPYTNSPPSSIVTLLSGGSFIIFVSGPPLLLDAARGQSAVRQLGGGEAPHQAAPPPTPAARQ